MKPSEQSQRNSAEDIVDGEVIAEFADDTLMNLPSMAKDQRSSISAPKIEDLPTDSGRRQLVVRLLMGGAAALALGGSAALLINRQVAPRVVILPNGAQAGDDGTVDVAKLITQVADLQASLDEATQERDQLRAQVDTLSVELQTLKPQVERANALNDLWKSLDEVGLDDLLNASIGALSTLIGGVMGIVGATQTGVKDGQAALDYIAKNLPKPQSGIQWLSSQITSLSKSLRDLATQVEQAIQPVEPYAQMIANFVTWVLNQLPFNIGAKARAGLEAMQAIIASLPTLVDGVANDVLDPLAAWFGSDPLLNLTGILLDPLNHKVLSPVRDLVAKVISFNDSFEQLLETPATDSLARRAAIREQIRVLEAKAPT